MTARSTTRQVSTLTVISLVLSVVALSPPVYAESIPMRGLAVTLELCADVDVGAVHEALAIEYIRHDLRQTNVTVACEGHAVRVKVIGPNHPRGRIADIDLSAVDAIAKPRTIALLAAELWSAPLATRYEPELAVDASFRPSELPSAKHRYRSGFSAGVSMQSTRREIDVGRESGHFRYADDLSMTSVHVDWPIWSHFGVFATFGQGESDTLRGNKEIGLSINWERVEMGMYVPIWRDRLRVDVKLSAGADTLEASGALRVDDRTLLPSYGFSSAGVDGSYILTDKINLLGWLNSYSASLSNDSDFGSGHGVRAGIGATYQVHNYIRAELRTDLQKIGRRNADTGRRFSDEQSTLSLGLSFTR